MKVKLTKSAVNEFNEEKFTAIPTATFNNMVSSVIGTNEDIKDEMIFFANVQEYVDGRKEYRFSDEKPVYVNEKGQVFVFVEPFRTDGTTNTEENTEDTTQSE